MTLGEAKRQIELISSTVAGAVTLMANGGEMSDKDLSVSTALASSVVENNYLHGFDAYVEFGQGIIKGGGEKAWDDLKAMGLALASPIQTIEAIGALLSSPDAMKGVAKETYDNLVSQYNHVAAALGSNTAYAGEAANLAGQDAGKLTLALVEAYGGVKGLTVVAKGVGKKLARANAPSGSGDLRTPTQARADTEAVHGAENVSSSTVPKKPQQASAKRDDVVVGDDGNKAVRVALDDGTVKFIHYDQRRLPIFDDVAKYTTTIKKPKNAQNLSEKARRKSEMRAATKQLREDIEAGRVDKGQFSDAQLKQIKAGAEKIKGYTWHHNAQSAPNNMQLVPSKIHNVKEGGVPHPGEGSISRGVKNLNI